MVVAGVVVGTAVVVGGREGALVGWTGVGVTVGVGSAVVIGWGGALRGEGGLDQVVVQV